jgi:hypothetical protein
MAPKTPPKKMEVAELLASYPNSYLRDDGVVMIETQPGQFTSQVALSAMGQMPGKPTPK